MNTTVPRLAEDNAHIRRTFLIAIAVGVALNTALVAVAFVAGPASAMWGALLGMGFALIVTLPTLVTALWGIEGSYGRLAGSVLGTWLIKMVGLIGAVLAARLLEGVSMQWAGVGLLLGAVVPTVVEISLLLRKRPVLNV